jgi:2-polyprenyl-3-methyl-5-hydroxy-6-metoxy-1,4-benzoquinol methylase
MGAVSVDDARAERERQAYDEDGVLEESHRWHLRARHVIESPNTRRMERRFDELVAEAVRNRRVLDVGCAAGSQSRRLLEMGAAEVVGADVSERFIEQARRQGEIPGRLRFENIDAVRELSGTYDVFFGRSILHHIDYRTFLRNAYDHHLSRGGTMIFMEPLGSNLITKAFHFLVKSAHTPDERPWTLADQRWLKQSFLSVELIPINFLSYPAGILSSLILHDPDNALLRAADACDVWLSRHVPGLLPQARQVILIIRMV